MTAKLKDSGRFMEVFFDELPPVHWRPRAAALSRRQFTAYVVVLCSSVLLTSGTALREASGLRIDLLQWQVRLWLAMYSLCQLLLHELAHVGALRAFGRRADRMGFKLNYWVFPAFYVRMNDTHLLTRSERVVVHSAGLFVNSIVGAIAFTVVRVLALGEVGTFVVTWYAVAMLMNAVPLLNSDGYRVLLAACGVTGRRESRHNPPAVRFAAGASAIVAVGYAAAMGARLIGALR